MAEGPGSIVSGTAPHFGANGNQSNQNKIKHQCTPLVRDVLTRTGKPVEFTRGTQGDEINWLGFLYLQSLSPENFRERFYKVISCAPHAHDSGELESEHRNKTN